MALVLKMPPATEPVSLEIDVKPHLRVVGNEEDVLISSLITTARGYVERITGRALITQTWQYVLDRFPSVFVLPKPPLRTVIGITYKTEDGLVHTIPAADYVVDAASEPARIAPAPGLSWPSDKLYPLGAVTVEFEAGYGDAADVPMPIKQAILLLAGHLYEHREAVVMGSTVTQVPFAVAALLSPYRTWWSP